MQERIGDLPPGALYGSRKGGAGYLHPLGAFLLVKPLEIRQSDRFEFVRFESDALQFALPGSAGFKAAVPNRKSNLSTASFPTH